MVKAPGQIVRQGSWNAQWVTLACLLVWSHNVNLATVMAHSSKLSQEQQTKLEANNNSRARMEGGFNLFVAMRSGYCERGSDREYGCSSLWKARECKSGELSRFPRLHLHIPNQWNLKKRATIMHCSLEGSILVRNPITLSNKSKLISFSNLAIICDFGLERASKLDPPLLIDVSILSNSPATSFSSTHDSQLV